MSQQVHPERSFEFASLSGRISTDVKLVSFFFHYFQLEEIHPEFSYKNASRDTINGLTKWFHVAEQMDIAEADRPATIKFVTLPLPSSR